MDQAPSPGCLGGGGGASSPGALASPDQQHPAPPPRLFPSDELIRFNQELAKLKASNHCLAGLAGCLREAYRIMCSTGREPRQTELDAVRRFLRDDLPLAMDKQLYATAQRAPPYELALFECLQQLVMIAALMLSYRLHTHDLPLAEWDADLAPLMIVIMGVLSSHRALHTNRANHPVPAHIPAKYEKEYGAMPNDGLWVVAHHEELQQQEEDDDMQEDGAQQQPDGLVEINAWFTHLANVFGQMDGFNTIVEMLLKPETVGFNMLNTCMAVLAQVVTDATDEAKDQFKRVLGPVSEHVLELVTTGSDRLADHGNDRTYNILNCLVNTNLPRIITYACADEEKLPWRRQLREILHAFVSKMLESSTFNKLLSGARECKKMLDTAATNTTKDPHAWEALQEHFAWMEENDIVQRLLRTGLHHKQYMNEVKGIMVILTQYSCLTAKHLDLMWAVTEKEDAYDAVKTHMFDLLAAVAAECQPAQLDMLFAKLERCQARSVQDTERLLALLESLADSDNEGKMEASIINLVWELTIPADAPPQLLGLCTMEHVVSSYCGELKRDFETIRCFKVILRCFDALKAGQGGIVPLLRTASQLLELLTSHNPPPKNKNFLSKERAVDELVNKHHVVAHLVDTVCARVSALRDKVAAATAAAAAAAGDGFDAPDAAAITAAAAAELDDGAWQYADTVREIMVTLKLLASGSSVYFADGLAERLWDTLMVDPPCNEDQLSLSFFRAGFLESHYAASYFEDKTQQQLLGAHMVKQDPQAVTFALAKLTWEVFAQVNSDGEDGGILKRQFEKQPNIYTAQDLERVKGLSLIWDIYLYNREDKVANHLRQHLLKLYHSIWWDDESHFFRQALVEELVARLHAQQDALAGSNKAQAQLAARAVARALALANAAVDFTEMHTMPPEPAHSRSWRGSPVQLEVQREGTSRLRITSHENEYIGLLRQRLALAMGCSAKSVRMFAMGHEILQDSCTVYNSGLRNRTSLQAMESPEPNKVTKAPSEHREVYEQMNMVSMFSLTDGLYPLLLKFIDAGASDATQQDIVSLALQLLAVLPTYSVLSGELSEALDGPDKGKRLADALLCADSGGAAGRQQHKQQPQLLSPYKTLYTMQALCELLFPTFDEALIAAMEREAKAEGSACPSPAGAAPAAAVVDGAAPAADAEAAQQQHHRELQQQEFVHCGGLEAFVQVAQMAAQCNPADLRLQRQLSELLVTLHHNLLNAALSWQSPPPLAAVAGHSNGPSAMSGAESGAGHPGGAPRHAAPASSLVGPSQDNASGAAAPTAAGHHESNSMAMADAVSGAAGDNSPGGKAAVTTSDTAYHHSPSSPAMEVSSPLPGSQQQQQGTKQRQRGGDLPPLPPLHAAQQQQQAGGGSGGSQPAAAGGPSLATLFSTANLRLMAESLLDIAVSTSQLWGSSDAAAAMPDDDSCKDVTVAREALQLLQRLLEVHPPMVQALRMGAEQTPLISRVLLSPFYTVVRRQAGELLERLVCIDSHRQRLLPWLLGRLASARPLAQQHPASCAEFYALLSTMLAKLGNSWGLLPEQLFATASSMLDEEVAALQAMAAAGPAQQGPLSTSARQQQQQVQQQQQSQGLRRSSRRRRQPAVISIDDADEQEDADAAEQPPACSLLQGRLTLVLALVRVLDRRAVGVEGQGGLMKLLLQEFLFPEAVAKVAAASGQLSLQRCAASLEPHCATPSSRKAALELLAELMGDTPASLEEGVSMLFALHYQQQVLQRPGLQPRALRGPGQYSGLKNGGATCYMNSVFQQLFMQPDIRARILGSAEVPEADKEDSVFAQLQGLFAQLALSKSTFAAPNRFWAAFKDYDGTPIDVREHQDAYEFFTRLQDFVDQHLISTNQAPAIKPVMGGTFVQQIICRGHDFTSERNEDFYQISVEVKGMGTLTRSLDDYVKGELMEGDNAYMCEELGKRVPAVKRTAIRSLPQMLCVHLKRFEFDYLNQTRHKLRDRFEFPLELDMFPYTAEGLAAADQQAAKAAEEQQQQQGQQQQPRQMRSSSTSGAGGGAGGASGAGAAAGANSSSNSNPEYMYDLHGVVVHSGSAFTGHYYSYIRERAGSSGPDGSSSSSSASSSSSSSEQEARWYCFDDKDVSPWDESNLEMDCFGGKHSQDYSNRAYRPPRNEYERAHSAYMLFYERRVVAAATADHGQCATAAGVQQQQPDDTDVDMAGDGASQPQQADVAAAAAAAGADEQQLQLARAPSGSGGFSIPYNLPISLFREITEANINHIWQLHVLDRHYFRFVRQLVDSRGDLGQLTTRKSRRREGGGGGAAAAGSGGLAHSSMACDPPLLQTPQAQQQQHAQPCPSTGSGALPMQVSPSPTPAASAPQADTGAPAAGSASAAAPAAATQSAPAVGPSPLELPGSSSMPIDVMQQSPGPSSRRGEEAEAVAQVLMRLGVLFQFQVYLYAHESLRAEANVWTEALRSLMGSGSSSTACMQVFLELVQGHPQWLSRFLVDTSTLSQGCPRMWASEMVAWTLQAASKRCAHQLQSYVSACLQHRIALHPDAAAAAPAAAANSPQAQETLLRTSLLPPLGQAMMGVVEQLVGIIHASLPRCNNAGIPIGLHDIPSEPARVLLAYAESSPWAAAHLLQTFNIVPDLADHITAALLESGADDVTCEELVPLLELLAEVLSFASNLPELTYEVNSNNNAGNEHQRSRNPFVRALPGSSSSSANSGSGNSSGGGGGGAADAAAAGGLRAALSGSAYCKLTRNSPLVRGVTHPVVLLECKRALHLAGLLTFSSFDGVVHWTPAAADVMHGQLMAVNADTFADSHWEEVCLKLALVALQPDTWLDCRVFYVMTGHWSPTGQQVVEPKAPGLLAYPNAISWPALATLKLLSSLIRHCCDPGQEHEQRMRKLLASLGKVLHQFGQQVGQDLSNLINTCKGNTGNNALPSPAMLQEIGQDLQRCINAQLQEERVRQQRALLQQQQQMMMQQQQQGGAPLQQPLQPLAQQQAMQADGGDEEVEEELEEEEEGEEPLEEEEGEELEAADEELEVSD